MIEKLTRLAKIIGILGGIITPFIIYYFSRERKELTFTIESSYVIVDLTKPRLSDLSIKYADIDIKQLYAIECRIENTGTKELTEEDFLDGVKILLDRTGKLITIDVDSHPQSISWDFEKDMYYVRLHPDLLNPNEFAKLTLFYSNDSIKNFGNPEIDARITNGTVKTISFDKEAKANTKFLIPLNKTWESIVFWTTIIFNGVYVILIIYSAVAYNKDKPTFAIILAALVLAYSLVTSMLFMIGNR